MRPTTIPCIEDDHVLLDHIVTVLSGLSYSIVLYACVIN